MRTAIRRRTCWAVLLIVLTSSVFVVAQETRMQVTRSISTAYALPESSFQVTLHVKANADLQGVGIREELPFGWTIQPVENAGAAFKRSEGEWVFNETVEAGASFYIVYEVTIPSARNLLSDPLPQCFSIHGTHQATVPSFETDTEGASQIEVVSFLPIATAIAHLIPASGDQPDTIDLRRSRTILAAQLERALQLWQQDLAVPETGGARIDLATINHLVALYETCTPADEALPLSIDPELVAIRTIETSLPCDSVLLPEGCLDPGVSAREVTVRVQITPAYDAYGIALKEWFPASWRISPIQHNGFWYRPSASEWVYPTRVRAGETVEVVYKIEVVSAATDALEAAAGCCGQEMRILGEARSALECSVASVAGEDTVTVEACIPVILAISRWDTEQDRFDAELSNQITFSQVQRAVRFWQDSLPVPHTCGYTVGYETLKQIVTYWLTGVSITSPLPQGTLDACGEDNGICTSAGCVDGWLCQLAEMQDPDDFVGLPDPPEVLVDGGPDRTISCAQPFVVLSASTSGGVAPFRFEWIGPAGQSLGDTQTIVATLPGNYTVVAVSCGGCMATDTVSVIGDFAVPSIAATVSGVLTGYVASVDVAVTISGGSGPFDIEWIGPAGITLGHEQQMPVTSPGTYAVTVVGANGCSASTSVGVTQDIEPPVVTIDIQSEPIDEMALIIADGEAVITCTTPEIHLSGTVTGGREPYLLTWTDSQGASLGESADLYVTSPGNYTLTATGANGCSASASAAVLQDIAPPVVHTSVSDVLTCLVSESTLSAVASEGTPPYTYVWTDADGTVLGESSEIAVQDPGRYSVTVTGANGCSSQASATVERDIEPPVVEAGVSGVLTCAQASALLTASVSGGRAPYTYAWRNAAGIEIATEAGVSVSTPGEYSVTVTGANGCSSQASVTVVQDIEVPVVQATVDGVLTCAVSQVNVHANITGGRQPLTIQWKNESQQVVGTDVLLPVSVPGVYTVYVVGANGCSATDSVTVMEDVAAPVVTIATPEALTCATLDVDLVSTVSGGRSPYTYKWSSEAMGSDLGSGSTLTVTAPGDYIVTVTGANGCTGSATVAVTQDTTPPVVTIAPPDELTCGVTEVLLSSEVTGGRPPFAYAWKDASGEIVGTADRLMVSSPGDYALIVTGANGCTGSATVVVLQDITPPTVLLGEARVLTCSEPEVTLVPTVCGGRAPYTYVWSDTMGSELGSGSTLTVTAPGEYVVTVTGANGCTGSASTVVLQDTTPPVVTVASPDELTCCVTEVLLSSEVTGGRPPFTYAWRDASGEIVGTADRLMVSSPGDYTLIVTGANGCAESATVMVLQDIAPPTVLLGEARVLTCSEPEVTLVPTVCGGRAPYTYRWTDDCGTVLTTSKDLSTGFAGIYTLMVTGANGCSSSRAIHVLDGIDPPVVDAGPDQTLVCVGDQVTLHATVVGGACPYEYTWVDSRGEIVGHGEDLIVSVPGTYIVSVRSSDGCVGVDSVAVQSP